MHELGIQLGIRMDWERGISFGIMDITLRLGIAYMHQTEEGFRSL
jgi:hypothetical protein